jgi:hypothetical protein
MPLSRSVPILTAYVYPCPGSVCPLRARRRGAGVVLCTLLALLGLLLPLQTWAGVAEGTAAYWRGDYTTALREFWPLAQAGNAEAQYSRVLPVSVRDTWIFIRLQS